MPVIDSRQFTAKRRQEARPQSLPQQIVDLPPGSLAQPQYTQYLQVPSVGGVRDSSSSTDSKGHDWSQQGGSSATISPFSQSGSSLQASSCTTINLTAEEFDSSHARDSAFSQSSSGGGELGTRATEPAPNASLGDLVSTIQSMMSKIDVQRIAKILYQNKFDVKLTISDLVDELLSATAQQNQYSQVLLQQSMMFVNQPEKPMHAGDTGGSPLLHQPANPMLVPPSGRRKCLLVGVNYSGTKNQLNGCNEDIRRVKGLLNKLYGFPDHSSVMTTLSDDKCTDRRFYPTKKNILGAIDWLVGGARPGDILFFQFSGHGSQKRNHLGTEADGFDETILPLDYKTAGHIRDDELFERLVRPVPPGAKLICVLDCCHSGSGLDLPYIWSGNRWTSEYRPKYADGDVILISSCNDHETAADVVIPGFGSGGALSLGLIMLLNKNPYETSFRVLLDELTLFLKDRKFRQRPQLTATIKFNVDAVRFNFVDIVRSS